MNLFYENEGKYEIKFPVLRRPVKYWFYSRYVNNIDFGRVSISPNTYHMRIEFLNSVTKFPTFLTLYYQHGG